MAMTTSDLVRAAKRTDIETLRAIVDATLFPGTMLDDMMRPFFDDDEDTSFWLVADGGAAAIGVLYCVPEEMADGAWNVKAIGVDPARHRTGAGRALMNGVEARLRQQNQRLVVVETSSAPEQDGACAFYRALGYREQGRLSDFWSEGEDKIIFTKRL